MRAEVDPRITYSESIRIYHKPYFKQKYTQLEEMRNSTLNQ